MQPIHFHIMVPIYKVEAFLDECIQSVLRQTYQNFTLYLLDDGSPDGCGTICDRYAAQDSRVLAFHKPNGRQLQTRCFGIAEAQKRGMTDDDYAVFLDGDDWLADNALETIANKIAQYRCDCVIYGALRMLNGEAISVLPNWVEDEILITEKQDLLPAIFQKNMNAIWRKCLRLNLLTGWDFSPYYHLSLAEDQLQSLQVYEKCGSFCMIPDALYCYRVNHESITQTICFENYRVDYTVEDTERAFAQRQPFITESALSAYRSYRIHALTGELVRIAQLKTSRKNRISLYEKIRQTNYWKAYLDGGHYDKAELGKMALIYEAFRHHQDWLILLIVKLYCR